MSGTTKPGDPEDFSELLDALDELMTPADAQDSAPMDENSGTDSGQVTTVAAVSALDAAGNKKPPANPDRGLSGAARTSIYDKAQDVVRNALLGIEAAQVRGECDLDDHLKTVQTGHKLIEHKNKMEAAANEANGLSVVNYYMKDGVYHFETWPNGRPPRKDNVVDVDAKPADSGPGRLSGSDE